MKHCFNKIQVSGITGMKPSALRDCSTYKFQFTSFLKFESHNKMFSTLSNDGHKKMFTCWKY
jgi:hypothetical protein